MNTVASTFHAPGRAALAGWFSGSLLLPAALLLAALSAFAGWGQGVYVLVAALLVGAAWLRRADPGPDRRASEKVAGSAAGTPLASDRWATSRAAFTQFGDRLIERFASAGQNTAVIVFEQADLPEVELLFGSEVARAATRQLQRKLAALAGPQGVAVRTDPTVWTVLLPGHDRQRAIAAVRRALGGSFSIELDTGADEMVLVPDFVVDIAAARHSLAQMHAALLEKIRNAHQHELRRQHYLRRERESHSSTMAMPLVSEGNGK